ncbi:uncharacterized protein LOC132192218 isoform X1 [Corylus avellana]|uniref:uncharacterized protein LOC132192218 isoform X1 n=1 Tax=Corylus avellana TaxID=13451 RepID=UPI00286A40EB|nr:uncharacterized protein LOC132192218 isoform X1 [Corylus avellana]
MADSLAKRRLSIFYKSTTYPYPLISISRPSSRPCYEIVFCMSFWQGKDLDEELTDWYSVKLYAQSPGEITNISPFWKGYAPKRSSVEAVGQSIYYFGGYRRSDSTRSRDVYSLCIKTRNRNQLSAMPSMIVPRIEPHTFVLDDKIYVLSGHQDHLGAPEIEAYDPKTGESKALPHLPSPLGYSFICAALENPSRIIVASPTEKEEEETAVFYQYDLLKECWISLQERRLHFLCPLGDLPEGGNAVTAGNSLYWVTSDKTKLLAYVVDDNLWLLGSLQGLGISFVEEVGYDGPNPFSFIHLENERFCLIGSDSNSEVLCFIIEVYHRNLDVDRNPIDKKLDCYRKPGDKRLEISVVSMHTYKTKWTSHVRGCILLGKYVDSEKKSSKKEGIPHFMFLCKHFIS